MAKHRRPVPRARYALLALGALAIGASPLTIPVGTHSRSSSKPFPIRLQPLTETFTLPVVPLDLTAATRLLPPFPAGEPTKVQRVLRSSPTSTTQTPLRFSSTDVKPSSHPVGTSKVLAAPLENASSMASRALSAALSLRGTPYLWGGTGPSGVDCSGLIVYAYRAAGISLPRTAADIATVGRPVSLGQLRPGDILAYYSPISHVVMYAGNGQVAEVSQPGTVVHVVPMYLQGYAAARRIVG